MVSSAVKGVHPLYNQKTIFYTTYIIKHLVKKKSYF